MVFLYSKWLSLPINVRHKIAKEFGIQKKGSTHVQDNVIQSDGYMIQDIEAALTISSLQLWLKREQTDLDFLWNELVFRMENPEIQVETTKMSDYVQLSDAQKKRPGRPKKIKHA